MKMRKTTGSYCKYKFRMVRRSAMDMVQRQNDKTTKRHSWMIRQRVFGVTSWVPRKAKREGARQQNIPIFILSIWNFFCLRHTHTQSARTSRSVTRHWFGWLKRRTETGPWEDEVGEQSALAKPLNYKIPINKSSVALVFRSASSTHPVCLALYGTLDRRLKMMAVDLIGMRSRLCDNE